MNKINLPGFVAILVLLPCAVAAQAPPANAPVQSFALPQLEELRSTRERPLFSPRRRPDAEVAGETQTSPVEESPDSLPFELTGVVLGADVAIAILRNRDTQETVQLRQGEALDAWSLEEIASRHVVLRQEDRQVRLELFLPTPEGSATSDPTALPPAGMRKPANLQIPQTKRSSQTNPSQRRALRRNPPRRGENP
ncbi:MAG: ral secretion pathway protein [Alphaproteobacteria bacterium]|jgi:general secretion pathway protein N|nr:ral secretion pathway protein [Alphaproteobacteria bacterium]